MGRFARDTGLDLENLQVTNLQAATITANSSPVLTVANSTFDNTIYVAKNGDDANDGLSLATPKLTIKAALAAASSGTAVKVASGTYEEDNPVTVPQNCAVIGDDLRTSSTTSANATCVYIDGSISSAISTKAMILGFMTIINRNGTGVHLVNQAYSQAVNIYTIAANVGILIESGSFATLNGSDCSIGNYGIIADGKTELYQGNVQGQTLAGNTTLTISNLSSFPRTNNGLIFDGDPNVYFISTFSNIGGNVWNVNVTSRLGNTFANGTAVTGYAVSTVSASAHTMEYVGAGTNPATALPQYGGIPIPENEVVETNDGRVNFTSTDQKGDFKIGSGLTINRATGTIEGDDFDRSLFAVLTPYILAIEGGFQ
jgi:hypothetical protein